jgi:hypothetical protein
LLCKLLYTTIPREARERRHFQGPTLMNLSFPFLPTPRQSWKTELNGFQGEERPLCSSTKPMQGNQLESSNALAKIKTIEMLKHLWKIRKLTMGWMVSTKWENFGCLQRLRKKAMREVLVALFPAGNSFTLDLTSRGEETTTFGLLESRRVVVSKISYEGKKPTSLDYPICRHSNLDQIFFDLFLFCLRRTFF